MKTLLCLLPFIALVRAADWGYSQADGPNTWANNYAICGQSSQSPINIELDSAKHDSSLNAFTFTGYNTLPAGAAYTLENNGYGAKVSLSATANNGYSVSGGGFPRAYHAAQFHFHWGSDNTKGSEHTVEGKEFPMELHIVQYSSAYANLSAAVDQPEGLAVLGFFFKVGLTNDAFDELCDHLKNVTYNGDSVSLTPFTLMSLLPQDLTSYFRYSGSLTTPVCYQSVIWTVFQDPIIISEAQMEKFRGLFFEAESSQTKTPMVNNYRPPQPLNSRQVLSSVSTRDPNKDCERFGICAACSVQFTTSLLSLMFALYYLVL